MAQDKQLTIRSSTATMEDWAGRVDRFLLADDRDILKDAGRISREIAKSHTENEFEKYRIVQDRLYVSDFDKLELDALKSDSLSEFRLDNRLVDESGLAVISRDNKPCYIVLDFEDYDEVQTIRAARRQKIEALAEQLIADNLEAFQELAK